MHFSNSFAAILASVMKLISVLLYVMGEIPAFFN